MIELKLLELGDAKALYELVARNKERLLRYFPITIRNNETRIATRQYLRHLKKRIIKKDLYTLGIYSNKGLIGVFFIKNIDWNALKCELGYFIDKDDEGKGIMTLAFDTIIDFCFEELKLEKIYVRTSVDNVGSRRLVEKKGFALEGILRNDFRIETNDLVDVAYYGKLKGE
jgi:ribosomal-protein-serine acetyltransferase